MNRLVCLFAALLAAPSLAQTQGFELEPGVRVLEPIAHAQLAIYPAVQTFPQAERAQFLTLQDGLKQKLVLVTEHKDGAQVNQVSVVNKSDKPLLVLGGELILGGKQDRVTQREQLVPARGEATIPVFCVEHGRWSGRREFNTTGGMVEARVKARAKAMKSQQAVWDEVARKTGALGGASATGTYRTVGSGEAGQKATKPFREAILPALEKLPERDRMIGLVATVNGEVVVAELFATPELFQKYRSALLESLFVTAADAPVVTTPRPAAGEREIKSFIHDADAQAERPVTESRDGRSYEKDGKASFGTTLETREKTKVYRSYLKK